MVARVRFIALVSLALTAGAAFAADTSKPTTKPTAEPAAAPVQIRPMSEGAVKSLPGAPSTPSTATRRPVLTADQKALEDIMLRGQAEVAALAQGLKTMPLGPARESIERKVVETKLRHRVEFLRTLAAQQRARGDIAAAQITDGVVDQILAPKPAPTHTTPQSPDRPGAVR
jgi:hypothetical protein